MPKYWHAFYHGKVHVGIVHKSVKNIKHKRVWNLYICCLAYCRVNNSNTVSILRWSQISKKKMWFTPVRSFLSSACLQPCTSPGQHRPVCRTVQIHDSMVWLGHSYWGDEAQSQSKGLFIHSEVQHQEDTRAGSWDFSSFIWNDKVKTARKDFQLWVGRGAAKEGGVRDRDGDIRIRRNQFFKYVKWWERSWKTTEEKIF